MLLAALCLATLPSVFQDPRTPETWPADRTLAWMHIPDVALLRGAIPRMPLLRVPDRPGWGTLLEGILGQEGLENRSGEWDKLLLPFDRGIDFVVLKSEGEGFGIENLVMGHASKASRLLAQRRELESLFMVGDRARQELIHEVGVAQDTPARYSWFRHRSPVQLAIGIPAVAVGRSDLCVLQAGRSTVLRVTGSFDATEVSKPPIAEMAGLVGLSGRKGRCRFGTELGEDRKGLLLSLGLEIPPWIRTATDGAIDPRSVPVQRLLVTLEEDGGELVERIRWVAGEGDGWSWFRPPQEGLESLLRIVSEDCVAAVRVGIDLSEVGDEQKFFGFLNKEVLKILVSDMEDSPCVDVELCLVGAVNGTTSPQPMILIKGVDGKLDSKAALQRISERLRDTLAPEAEVLVPKPYVRKSGIHYIKFVDYWDEYSGGLLARLLLGGGYLSIGKLGDRVAITCNPKTLRMAQRKLAQGKTLAGRVPALTRQESTEGALGQGFLDYQGLATRFGALAEFATQTFVPLLAFLPQGGNVQMQVTGLKSRLLPALAQEFPLQTFEVLRCKRGAEVVSRGGGLFSPSQWALACEAIFCLARIDALSRF